MLYTIPYLALLEGLYSFTVATVNQEDTIIYDYHDRLYAFRVNNHGENVSERYGLMTMRGEWKKVLNPLLPIIMKARNGVQGRTKFTKSFKRLGGKAQSSIYYLAAADSSWQATYSSAR